MLDTFKELIGNQFDGAFSMLNACIDKCPEAVWTSRVAYYLFFFFQAEDGIRDKLVTGVQTCALPILRWGATAQRASTAIPAPPLTSSRIASVNGTAETRRGVTPAGLRSFVKTSFSPGGSR